MRTSSVSSRHRGPRAPLPDRLAQNGVLSRERPALTHPVEARVVAGRPTSLAQRRRVGVGQSLVATMFLRVAGASDGLRCGRPRCVVCADGARGGCVVHGEPVERARHLAAHSGVVVPELAEPLGSEAPVGHRYDVDELPRVIAALEALSPPRDGEPQAQEHDRDELREALEVFRAARTHHKPVVLEV